MANLDDTWSEGETDVVDLPFASTEEQIANNPAQHPVNNPQVDAQLLADQMIPEIIFRWNYTHLMLAVTAAMWLRAASVAFWTQDQVLTNNDMHWEAINTTSILRAHQRTLYRRKLDNKVCALYAIHYPTTIGLFWHYPILFNRIDEQIEGHRILIRHMDIRNLRRLCLRFDFHTNPRYQYDVKSASFCLAEAWHYINMTGRELQSLDNYMFTMVCELPNRLRKKAIEVIKDRLIWLRLWLTLDRDIFNYLDVDPDNVADDAQQQAYADVYDPEAGMKATLAELLHEVRQMIPLFRDYAAQLELRLQTIGLFNDTTVPPWYRADPQVPNAQVAGVQVVYATVPRVQVPDGQGPDDQVPDDQPQPPRRRHSI